MEQREQKEFCEMMIGSIAAVIDSWREFNGVDFVRKGGIPNLLSSFDLAKCIVHSSFFMQEIRHAIKKESKKTAKEIAGWLNTNTYTVTIYKKGLNAFLKEQFGVEVGE